MVDAHAMPAKEGIVCAAFNSHSTDFAKQGITNYAVLPHSQGLYKKSLNRTERWHASSQPCAAEAWANASSRRLHKRIRKRLIPVWRVGLYHAVLRITVRSAGEQ